MSQRPDDLARLNSVWRDAKAEKGYAELPDGRYQCSIDRVQAKISQKGNPMFSFGLKVLAGEYRGRYLWKNSMLTEVGMGWLKKDLAILGIELPAVEGDDDEQHGVAVLWEPEWCRKFLDIAVEITKETVTADDGTEYKNVYFQSRLDGHSRASTEEPPPKKFSERIVRSWSTKKVEELPAEKDDDIPF